jgi:hypothetical protein
VDDVTPVDSAEGQQSLPPAEGAACGGVEDWWLVLRTGGRRPCMPRWVAGEEV